MRRQIMELLVDVHVDGASLDNNMLQASNQETSISHSPAQPTHHTCLLESIHKNQYSRHWPTFQFTPTSCQLKVLPPLPFEEIENTYYPFPYQVVKYTLN